MTRSTVSRLVDELITAGIVAEQAPIGAGSRGRPAVPLTPATKTLVGIGVEVNVDFMTARAMDLSRTVLAESSRQGNYQNSDPQQVLEQAGRLALEVASQAESTTTMVVGTVLAVPGLVNADERTLLLAPNLGWKNIDLLEHLCSVAGDEQDHSMFGQFLSAANEAKLAALAIAEDLTDTQQRGQTFLYVSGEHGIGSAVVLGGTIDVGPHGWAGELGHICVHPDGPRCQCGSNGCLEVFAGKRELLKAAGLPVDSDISALRDMVESASTSNPQATEVIAQAGWALGVALSSAMNVLDIHHVVLGGDFGPISHLLQPHIEAELHKRVLASPWSQFHIQKARTNPAPAATGAAIRALQSVINSPQHWTES